MISGVFILLFRYPDGLAWQLNLERKVIRNCEALEKLKAFLVSETESVRKTFITLSMLAKFVSNVTLS